MMQKNLTKRRIIQLVVACILMGLIIVGWITYRGLNYKTWMDYTASDVENLAMFFKTYRDDHGNYPLSLDDLIGDPDSPAKDFLPQFLNRRIGGAKNRYEYLPSSNGFLIIAFKPRGFLSKSERLEISYKWDEAIEQYNV